MKKVRWGVLSTAKIGLDKVIPAMQKSRYCDVVAIASRSPEKAKSAATELGIPKYYGAYQDMLYDPDIDAVYNPLPNHLHVPWSIKSLEAGKHVLCEKPLALTADEASGLLDMSKRYPDLKIMEAFMYRFHPQWQKTKELVHEGGIGQLKTIHSIFSYYNVDSADIRNKADIGGGGLMDIGCYNISLSRLIFGAEPTRVFGFADYDPKFKTDRLASAILDFGSGTSTFTCSTQLCNFQRANIFGTSGRIEIEIPFTAPPHKACRLWHQDGQEIREIVFDAVDQYTIQCDEFARAVLNNSPVPYPLKDGVANMRVIEAVFMSVAQDCWVSL
ncbi:NAD-binding protein [candidate division KSB1 bacterium RBG_16_48_16]|nr:MAG: NAD-binding protein [candidate division KSB1 bacterium RBG_16_48_16]